MEHDNDSVGKSAVDVAKLNYDVGSSMRSMSEAVEALKAARPQIRAAEEAVSNFKNNKMFETATQIAENFRDTLKPLPIESFVEAANSARRATDAINTSDLLERMHNLKTIAGEGSTLARAAEGIARQQRSIDGLMAERESYVPRVEHLSVPENPIIETNRRLARIEDHFENSAQVATELQASAAEFIQDFKSAADETSKSSRIAIWVAVAAVVITLWQSVSPFLFPDREAEALRRSVETLAAEIATLKVVDSGVVPPVQHTTRNVTGPR